MTTARKIKLHRVWNKDGTVTIFARGKKVWKSRAYDTGNSSQHFMEGWFGTSDQTQWNFRQTFK